ncbi:hyalin-like [Amphiura filiformis]|uniref:hyalin-like n=1 Tax=Amphiura filiformis TaxID=82378 RepID=UPI003B227A82
MWSFLWCMNQLLRVALFLLSIQVLISIVSCQLCVLEERPDPSRGGALRWSMPYKKRCHCQRVVAPRKLTQACPVYDDGSGEMKLWFVDDPTPLTNRMNWNKEALDSLFERQEYCDKEAPVIASCPADQEIETYSGKATAMFAYDNPTAIDNSGEVSVECYPTSQSEFLIGKTTVTCVARDNSNNSKTCNFQVLVKDAEAPEIAPCPADQEIETNQGKATAMFVYDNPTATDNSGAVSVECHPISQSEFIMGKTTVTCVARDNSGNNKTCDFQVLVKDIEAPVITLCPADHEIETNPGKATAMFVYDNPIATDNSGEVSVECYPLSQSKFIIGQTTVTCVARDNSENNQTCDFHVLVKDEEAPVITSCHADQEIETDPGKVTAMFVYNIPTQLAACTTDSLEMLSRAEKSVVQAANCTATDNSGEVSVECDPLSQSEFVIGQTTVTCVARDNGENNKTCDFQVLVKETYCSTGWDIIVYPQIDPLSWVMVSPDKYIHCNGVVTEWRLLAKAAGILKVIIWRHDSGDSFQVIGINTISISTDRINQILTYSVSESEGIQVQAGDMIGWASQDGILARDREGDALVQWGSIVDVSSLVVNGYYQINSASGIRDYAIHATVTPNEGKIIY